MFEEKYFGLPLWVWIIVIVIVGYSVLRSCEKPLIKSENKQEVKEKFADTVENTNKKPIVKIFNFNTEWCGWSRKFQPEWDAFMAWVKNPDNKMSHVQAFDVKCDNDSNKSLCEEYKVPGYPYVVIEVNGSRGSYEGERTKEALISFVSNI
jgi:hypothetical protein